MKNLYSNPFRVYLVIIALAIIGVIAGLKLPISLYPNSNKPTIWVSVSYGHLNAEEFIQNYGNKTDSRLKAVTVSDVEVKFVKASYEKSNAEYEVEFEWGTDPKEAKREVESVINSLSSSWPKEIRDSAHVGYWSKSSGFIAISFFSEIRGIDELYTLLEPIIVPKLSAVADAENPSLYNPARKEISVVLDTESMTKLNLLPKDIVAAFERGLRGYIAGSLVIGTNKLSIEMPRFVESLKDLNELLVKSPSGSVVHLGDIAKINLADATDSNRIYKTNGSKSLILFANPKTGGNVKRMAEQTLEIVKKAMPELPSDIQYRVLVDPSEFIRASIKNVIHEVFLAAALAVFVLFLFLGSLKNTITAAIEIPLSMILAFVLMKVFNMNLNLISLGGLALAAGMNVDASVVVMENIFRNLNQIKGPLNFQTRLALVFRSINEVKLPIIASTISTLVVFAPLAFTSHLTNAILGDLAKAVVFSHCFSMFIALILVPTIRLHIMNSSKEGDRAPISPINKQLTLLEGFYEKTLKSFILSKKVKLVSGLIILSSLIAMSVFIVPNLRREIIGTPDTDWMVLSIRTQGNTLIKQMEETASEEERRLLDKFQKDIKYTFTQIRRPNRAIVMARLKDKGQMDKVWKRLEEEFENTPTLSYWVGPWNPAELPLPNPPDMKLVIRGGSPEDRVLLARDLKNSLREKDVFPHIWTDPSSRKSENIVITPHLNRWPLLNTLNVGISPFDLTDLSRVATEGKKLGTVFLENKDLSVKMKYTQGAIMTKEDLEAFPLGIKERIIPFKALATVKLEPSKPQIYKENGRELMLLSAKQKKGQEAKVEASMIKAKEVIGHYRKNDLKKLNLKSPPTFYFVDSKVDLNNALEQLSIALVLSALLIFLTLLFQFGALVHSLIIMVAIPFGIFGGILSLYLFDSTLSLNSVLGIILLNGIAVNNSIILVDFIRSLHKEGHAPLNAALMAAKKRLRPILITSLTTILGMFPIALGLGDGGKILQPLGLTVAGGLWFSMAFTLFFIPTLEVIYLNFRAKRSLLVTSSASKLTPSMPNELSEPLPNVLMNKQDTNQRDNIQ